MELRTIDEIRKRERNKMLIELMKMILNTGFCPGEWKNARTILLYKDGEKSNTRIWRPITVTSAIYRTIFCKIAQALHEAHENERINMFDIEQK
jgi:hypothetical protein